MKNKLLSITIPTYNRAEWLKICLSQLFHQIKEQNEEVEVIVFDNASPDHTESIVSSFLNEGLPITYKRNSENIGSDKNIAQCFNKSTGKYLLILGDDDVLLDNTLAKIINHLKNEQYGAIYMRAYGYDNAFIDEKPFQIHPRSTVFSDTNAFMVKCSSNMAFISSLIINKSLITDIDANQFTGTSLVQTYLFYEAARRAKKNLYIDEYLIAAKRIENRDYDVPNVFCNALNDALDYFVSKGLSSTSVNKINNKLLWYFFPFFLMQLRSLPELENRSKTTYEMLKTRYYKNLFFWACSAPILKLPHPISRIWGSLLIILSRIINGETGRLLIAIKKLIIGILN